MPNTSNALLFLLLPKEADELSCVLLKDNRFGLYFHMGRRERETRRKRKTKGESGNEEEFP
jgi:hypothetical protein